MTEPLRPSESALQTTYQVLPPDTNHFGHAFGGRIMEWMDVAAGIAASRHCREPAVTVAVDDLCFARPIKMGDVVIIHACVNYTGKTSMEVGVRVDRENRKTRRREHCLSGYFTFVAIDSDNQPIPVPAVEPLTETELRRFKNAQIRRDNRLQRRVEK
ncbi:MAG: acyl-CoA thioesterase [Myxococcota bacterium]|nr:acyl-CoA thioesterase [Myxococcota bacterium]